MKLRVVLVILGVWVALSTSQPTNEGGKNQDICQEVTREEEKDSNSYLREAITLLHEHHVHNLHHPHEGHRHRGDLYDRINSVTDLNNPANIDISVHSTVDANLYEPDHYDKTSTWVYASCDLLPNADLKGSNVRGRIDISTREGVKQSGVYFDIYVSGIDINKNGKVYGIHVHDNPVQDQRCNSTCGFYKPSALALENPSFRNDHIGNLGDYHVSQNGVLDHVVPVTIDATFEEVIGKPIVIHSLDIIRGEGHVKDRLACCNIIQTPST